MQTIKNHQKILRINVNLFYLSKFLAHVCAQHNEQSTCKEKPGLCTDNRWENIGRVYGITHYSDL